MAELEEEVEMPAPFHMSLIEEPINPKDINNLNATQVGKDMDIRYLEDVESQMHKADSCQERNTKLLQQMKSAFNTLNNIENGNSVCNGNTCKIV